MSNIWLSLDGLYQSHIPISHVRLDVVWRVFGCYVALNQIAWGHQRSHLACFLPLFWEQSVQCKRLKANASLRITRAGWWLSEHRHGFTWRQWRLCSQLTPGHQDIRCGSETRAEDSPPLALPCNECGFPVRRPCYEYERREGTQLCPQCKTRYKRLRGAPVYVTLRMIWDILYWNCEM